MSCILDYLSYYYNYYCFSKKQNIKNDINNYNYSSTKVEIDNTYDLLFTSLKKSYPKLNIVLYEIYNNGINIHNKNKTQVFLYDNRIYKICNMFNIKRYLSIIHTIRNYNINDVIIPIEIYHNKLQNETVQIYDYYSKGDLFDYFVNNNLSYNNILYLYKLIVNIISKLHNNNIAHRDLKLENFLIYYDESNEIKIILIDLDYSIFLNNNDNFIGGTEQYASYEILNNKNIDNWFSVDLWSIGIILYIFIFKEFPWHNCHHLEDTFINYNNNYCNTYWYNKLIKLDMKEDQLVVYSKIFNYCFNLDSNERTDINYIKDLLTTI